MEQVEKQTAGSKITTLIVKSRFVIIAVLIALILAAIVIGVVLSVKDSKVLSGLTALDALEFRYESLDTTADTFEADQNEILSEANTLAQGSTGVVSVRSLLFVGDINFEVESWIDAQNAYFGAYEADKNAYTAPLALYNAAISAEENGDLGTAVEYLNIAKTYKDFSLMARTLFNLGRIEETLGNIQSAIDIYTELNDAHPSTSWANLAKSRLIVLTSESNVE